MLYVGREIELASVPTCDPTRAMKRKIAAILAADVAEYSRLVAEDEEDTLRRLVAAQSVFNESVTAHHGRIFNTAGDAILAEFASAVEAARSALDIQERMSARNKAYPPSRRLAFRIGLSIGDVAEHGNDLLGDGVNIAARLQTLAPPGGLAISHWVQEQTAGKLSVTFRNIGNQTLKNIPVPVNVFIADLQSVDAAVTPAASVSRSAPNQSRQTALMLAGLAAVITIAAVALTFQRSTSPAPASPPATATEPKQEPSATPAPQPISPPPPALPQSPTPPASEVIKITPPPVLPPVVPEVTITPPPRAPTQPLPSATLPKSAPPATEKQADTDRKRQAKSCTEVLERAQLGDLTVDDREFLRTRCR